MRWGFKHKHKYIWCVPVAALLLSSHIILKRAEPVFNAQCSNYSNTAFTELVNQCISDMTRSGEFRSFFIVDSGSSGRISSIEADTARLNYVKSQLLINIQNALNADYPAHVFIPLGSLSPYSLLSSFGPSLKIRIIPISVVNGELDEAFESVGINQVRHKIYLNVTVDMQYIGYTFNETENIHTSVPIAETVICGEVPEFYGSGMIHSDGS